MEPKGNVDWTSKLIQNYFRKGAKLAEPAPRVQGVYSRRLRKHRLKMLGDKFKGAQNKLVLREDGTWELLPP